MHQPCRDLPTESQHEAREAHWSTTVKITTVAEATQPPLRLRPYAGLTGSSSRLCPFTATLTLRSGLRLTPAVARNRRSPPTTQAQIQVQAQAQK